MWTSLQAHTLSCVVHIPPHKYCFSALVHTPPVCALTQTTRDLLIGLLRRLDEPLRLTRRVRLELDLRHGPEEVSREAHPDETAGENHSRCQPDGGTTLLLNIVGVAGGLAFALRGLAFALFTVKLRALGNLR
jgi:hypothetical protein